MIKVIYIFFIFFTFSFANNSINERDIIKSYIAIFKRAPSFESLIYWQKNEKNLNRLLKIFLEQKEANLFFQKNQSPKEFINRVYLNLFNRNVDKEGLLYWENMLNQSQIEKSDIVLKILNSASNTQKYKDLDTLTNKTNIGAILVNIGFDNKELSKYIISNVTDDKTSVNYIKQKIITNDLKNDFLQDYKKDLIKTKGQIIFKKLDYFEVYYKNKYKAGFSFNLKGYKFFCKYEKNIKSFSAFFNSKSDNILLIDVKDNKINTISKILKDKNLLIKPSLDFEEFQVYFSNSNAIKSFKLEEFDDGKNLVQIITELNKLLFELEYFTTKNNITLIELLNSFNKSYLNENSKKNFEIYYSNLKHLIN